MGKKKYVTKMPKLMILMHIDALMKIIKKVHIAALKGDTEEIQDLLVDPESMMHLMVAKILTTKITDNEEEMELLEKEMDEYEEHYKADIAETDNIIASAELDVFLHGLGIKRDNDARDVN